MNFENKNFVLSKNPYLRNFNNNKRQIKKVEPQYIVSNNVTKCIHEELMFNLENKINQLSKQLDQKNVQCKFLLDENTFLNQQINRISHLYEIEKQIVRKQDNLIQINQLQINFNQKLGQYENQISQLLEKNKLLKQKIEKLQQNEKKYYEQQVVIKSLEYKLEQQSKSQQSKNKQLMHSINEKLDEIQILNKKISELQWIHECEINNYKNRYQQKVNSYTQLENLFNQSKAYLFNKNSQKFKIQSIKVINQLTQYQQSKSQPSYKPQTQRMGYQNGFNYQKQTHQLQSKIKVMDEKIQFLQKQLQTKQKLMKELIQNTNPIVNLKQLQLHDEIKLQKIFRIILEEIYYCFNKYKDQQMILNKIKEIDDKKRNYIEIQINDFNNKIYDEFEEICWKIIGNKTQMNYFVKKLNQKINTDEII